MRNRILHIMISLVLLLILSSSGVCAILSLYPDNTSCQKNKALDAGVRMAISELCNIPLCNINQPRLFTLPDVLLRRLETESRSVLNNLIYATLSAFAGVLPDNQLLKAALKTPLSFKPPQIIYLNCTLIC
jgi:hypothetical protein